MGNACGMIWALAAQILRHNLCRSRSAMPRCRDAPLPARAMVTEFRQGHESRGQGPYAGIGASWDRGRRHRSQTGACPRASSVARVNDAVARSACANPRRHKSAPAPAMRTARRRWSRPQRGEREVTAVSRNHASSDLRAAPAACAPVLLVIVLVWPPGSHSRPAPRAMLLADKYPLQCCLRAPPVYGCRPRRAVQHRSPLSAVETQNR